MSDLIIETRNKLDLDLNFKISRFKEQIKKTRAHKHDEYYELIYLSEGEGFHCIESEKFMISAPEFYFLKPGQLHFWQFTSIPKGFVILFREACFDGLTENDLIKLYRQLGKTTRISVQNSTFHESILTGMLNEYNLNRDFSEQIIHGLLRALFGKLLQSDHDTESKPSAPHAVFDHFQHLLVRECPRLHRVNEFAALLNTTPQRLNSLCRKRTGKCASELIASQVLLEAKRYILHTDHTINEIADLLSFNDASYFVRYFKKAVGLTPVKFRGKYYQ